MINLLTIRISFIYRSTTQRYINLINPTVVDILFINLFIIYRVRSKDISKLFK